MKERTYALLIIMITIAAITGCIEKLEFIENVSEEKLEFIEKAKNLDDTKYFDEGTEKYNDAIEKLKGTSVPGIATLEISKELFIESEKDFRLAVRDTEELVSMYDKLNEYWREDSLYENNPVVNFCFKNELMYSSQDGWLTINESIDRITDRQVNALNELSFEEKKEEKERGRKWLEGYFSFVMKNNTQDKTYCRVYDKEYFEVSKDSFNYDAKSAEYYIKGIDEYLGMYELIKNEPSSEKKIIGFIVSTAVNIIENKEVKTEDISKLFSSKRIDMETKFNKGNEYIKMGKEYHDRSHKVLLDYAINAD